MTDEQLAVLLRDKMRALEKARNEAADELPEECVEEGRDVFGFKKVRIPALASIDQVIHNLQQDIKDLLGEGE